ncbi:pheromone A receptor-domain-containing protein [Collybia nuda]|uniref:Pheromone A receptor-domain-containing protein n=1 Tax=Collybia nuda TaxID=64659 RepID=A0A9P5XZ02_9AGAR|nr:pheromone A receptor-domain-containing protein [Collybia nuda]
MSYPNYVFSLFAFIGFTLALIPLRWHLDVWNVGTCLYMLWTAAGCLNQFINSVVWNGNTRDAPGWCDISVRIIIGASTAIPAASLCINRRLYRISHLQTAKISDAEKRRGVIIEFAIALGLPIFFIVISFIPQVHRYDIAEDIGCIPVGYPTPVFIALVHAPPVAIGCVTAVYSVLSIKAFFERQKHLQELMAGSTSLDTNRYFRLMCVAGIDVVLTIPLGCFAIYDNIKRYGGVQPWVSWANIHSNFNVHGVIPASSWRANPYTEGMAEFNRWMIILCAFTFFTFFGFAEEARRNYLVAFMRIASWFGYGATPSTSIVAGVQVKPSNMIFTNRRAATVTNAATPSARTPRTEENQPTPGSDSKLFAFVKRTLRLDRKPPLLPLTFTPNIISLQSSYSSESRDRGGDYDSGNLSAPA